MRCTVNDARRRSLVAKTRAVGAAADVLGVHAAVGGVGAHGGRGGSSARRRFGRGPASPAARAAAAEEVRRSGGRLQGVGAGAEHFPPFEAGARAGARRAGGHVERGHRRAGQGARLPRHRARHAGRTGGLAPQATAV